MFIEGIKKRYAGISMHFLNEFEHSGYLNKSSSFDLVILDIEESPDI